MNAKQKRELAAKVKKEAAEKELTNSGCVKLGKCDRWGFWQVGWWKGEQFIGQSCHTAVFVLKSL